MMGKRLLNYDQEAINTKNTWDARNNEWMGPGVCDVKNPKLFGSYYRSTALYLSPEQLQPPS